MAIPSPCLDTCRFNKKADLCVGCFRTRDEVRRWKKMTDHKRRQVLSERPKREAKMLTTKSG